MIAAIIPTLNEEDAIGEVVEAIPGEIQGQRVETYVIDGGSEDATRRIAEEAGAAVVEQYYRGGKGAAVRQAFDEIDADIYIFLDGDGTYDPEEMEPLMQPVIDGEADHVVGSRLENREEGSITLFNLVGNKLFNALVRNIYGAPIKDMLSGYRAITHEAVEKCPVFREGFGIETELTIQSLENNVRIVEVPITYKKRRGSSKLHPLTDGFRIMETILWMVRDTRPLQFFSGISLFFLLLSLYPGYLTAKQKVVEGVISNLAPPLIASLFLIFALQTFLFGLIADQQRRMQNLVRRKG